MTIYTDVNKLVIVTTKEVNKMYRPIEKDPRYTISKEWTGKEKPQFVVRFCDEWICSSSFYSSAVIRAVGHTAERRGALTITAQEA